MQNYNDANQVRNCRLSGLRDLKGGTTYVREQLANYLNKLVSWGVAGFRIDAAKHMWPGDIHATVTRLNNLNTQWFPANTKPYIYQEVKGCDRFSYFIYVTQ
jgi:alpha-amylase